MKVACLRNATILRTTSKAMLVSSKKIQDRQVWIPLSCIDLQMHSLELEGAYDLVMPMWLGRKIGLNVD